MNDLDFDNNIPIYLQIVNKIKIQIISNKLKLGEKILSVREFALLLKVNPNTMQKALNELENLGLIYTERTNGKYVTTDEKLIKDFKKKYAEKLINEFVLNMNNVGFNIDETITYLKNIKEK